MVLKAPYWETQPPTPPLAAEEVLRVTLVLRRYIGPIADELVHRVLAFLVSQGHHQVTVESLIDVVSNYIDEPAVREQFCDELLG